MGEEHTEVTVCISGGLGCRLVPAVVRLTRPLVEEVSEFSTVRFLLNQRVIYGADILSLFNRSRTGFGLIPARSNRTLVEW